MGMGTYYHVTTDEAWTAIQKADGLQGGEGVCGYGVYLWDDLDLALEFVEDLGAPKPVVLKIETDEAISCEEALGGFPEKEGDQAYYEHVFLVRVVKGLWRPERMKRIRIA